MMLLDGDVNKLGVKRFDALPDAITKVVPGSSSGLVPVTEPLHGFVEFRLLAPLGRGADPLEHHVQNHPQHHKRVIGFSSRPVVNLVKDSRVELIRLPSHQSCLMVGIQFLVDFLPATRARRHRDGAEPGFLILQPDLQS